MAGDGRRTSCAAVLLAGLALLPGRAGAQQVVEIGPQASLVAADPASVVAGGYAAIRTAGRSRFAIAGGLGAADEGDLAWRAEFAGHFLLSPRALSGTGAYLGGGIAAADAGEGANGYLMLLAGLESRPGAPSGWAVEAALGGGVRLSVGWRWRRFPPNWRFRR